MVDAYVYTAMAGDTFDSISLDFYNEEARSTVIIQANPKYRNVLVFAGGEELYVPIIEVEPAATLAPWRRGSA